MKHFLSISILSVVSVFLMTAYMADARTVVRTGEAVSVADDQEIEGDFYGAAAKVNLSGSVSEDMVAAGGKITVNGTVGDNAWLVGGQTDVHGTIGDDLRIFSGEVTIAEPVMGDVFVIGGSVNILSTASVAGDVLLFVQDATIEGSVGGDVLGNVETLRIDAVVSGDVDVTVGQFTLGDRSTIEGDVKYTSPNVLLQSLDATIDGDIVRSDPVLPGSKENVRSSLVPVLVLTFSVLAWFLVSRRTLQAVVSRSLVRNPRPILFGVVALVLTPIAVVVLLVSMIGMLAGFVLLFAYAMFMLLALVATPLVLGQLLMKALNRPGAKVSLLTVGVGVVAVIALMLLPVLGQIVLMTFFLLALGAMVDLCIRA